MTDLGTADVTFFIELVSAGTQARAARELGITPTAVGKRLNTLEKSVGATLVRRRPRGFELTDEGQLFLKHARLIQDELRHIHDAFARRSGKASGILRVVVSSGFGRRFVAPALAVFKGQHPDIDARLILSDEVGMRLSHACDLVVHIGPLPDSAWIGRKLADNKRILCAAPSYVSRFGAPSAPEELAHHKCLVVREYDVDALVWTLTGPDEVVARTKLRPWLSSNDGDVIREWALAGEGIMQRSEWDVAELLSSGELVEVLPNFMLPTAPIMALVPTRAYVPPRVSYFVDFLAEQIGSPPRWRTAGAREKLGLTA